MRPEDAEPDSSRPRHDFRRAAVLGGAGFVGSHLSDVLIEAGIAVACVDNFCTGNVDNVWHLIDRPDFELIDHDVTDPLPDIGPVDVVFCLASPASPTAYSRLQIETLRAGAIGTEQGLQLAERCAARFVLASTSEVYGDPEVHPQTEDYVGHVNPIGPRSVYDEAKRYAEAITAAYGRTRGVDVGIARLFNTYGPRMRSDDGRMVPTFIAQIMRGQPCTLTGTGQQTRSICYVSDTVAGLLSLARSFELGPINLGNSDERTVLELAELIARLMGVPAAIRFVPAVLEDPRRRCPDISRAAQLLDWRPLVQMEEGLKQTIAWYLDNAAL
jgi:dTDP-glucose 4,6-dehydratase